MSRYDQMVKEDLSDTFKNEIADKKAIKRIIKNRKKACMLICLLFNLGILVVLKYTNFIIVNINELTGRTILSSVDLIVPLGLSFYTFQAVGYLLDVYWGKSEAQKNFWDMLLFVSFFPQLIQGPISRYGDLSKTLYERHSFNYKCISFGLERILWGYFKKLVVADRIGVAVAAIMSDPEYYSGGYVFIGMVFYAAQLYADFTGGIDITIGIAEVLGIHIEENFIRPFFSKNITEYWRRWHISMGTWFRDYVFYPLSISAFMKNTTKKTKKHFGTKAAKRIAVYISTLATWLATGIWHGADWHFIVWGLANGIILLVTYELEPLYDRFHRKHPALVSSLFWKCFQIIRTFMLLCCLRLFDTYASVRLACRQFVCMFTELVSNRVTASELLDLGLNVREYIIFFIGVTVMFMVSMYGRDNSVREKVTKKPFIVRYIPVQDKDRNETEKLR